MTSCSYAITVFEPSHREVSLALADKTLKNQNREFLPLMQRDTRIEISFSSIEVANLILNTVGVDTIQVTLQDRDTS